MTKSLAIAMMIASLATAASAGERDIVIASCKSELRMSNSECDCIAGKFEELEPKQQRAFLVFIKEDRAEMAKLQGEMTIAEMTAVGNAMDRMPKDCAGQ